MGTGSGKFVRQFALDGEGLALEEIDLTPGNVTGEVREIEVDRIGTSPYQPRTKFPEAGIRTLADSIAGVGQINPITVRPKGGGYELISGERRLRAVRLLGHGSVKAVVHDVDDITAAVMAFDENFRRKNLSEYENFRWVTIMIDRFGLRQADIAARLSLTAGRLSQIMAVGKLPGDVVERIAPLPFVTEFHIRALRRLQKMDGRLMYRLLAEMERDRPSGVEVLERFKHMVARAGIVRTPLDDVLEDVGRRISRIRRNPGRYTAAELRQVRVQVTKMGALVNEFLASDLGTGGD